MRGGVPHLLASGTPPRHGDIVIQVDLQTIYQDNSNKKTENYLYV